MGGVNIDLKYGITLLAYIVFSVWVGCAGFDPTIKLMAYLGVAIGVQWETWLYGRLKWLQWKGLYPKGKPTDEDVRFLMETGRKIEAIKMYRELHRVTLPEAVAAVERMV